MKAYNLRKLKILVLEKHVLIRKLLTDVFREFGVATVQSTHDLDIAFSYFKQFPSDVVLSDWTPDLDGMRFLRMIRHDVGSPNPYVPVIVVTANTEFRHVCEARDKGMTEFLAKPISAKLIYSRIVSIIESNRTFIRSADFFGPDRRRHIGDYGGANKRSAAAR